MFICIQFIESPTPTLAAPTGLLRHYYLCTLIPANSMQSFNWKSK